MRGRRLAEAATAVNDLLLSASATVSAAAAGQGGGAGEVQGALVTFLQEYERWGGGVCAWGGAPREGWWVWVGVWL